MSRCRDSSGPCRIVSWAISTLLSITQLLNLLICAHCIALRSLESTQEGLLESRVDRIRSAKNVNNSLSIGYNDFYSNKENRWLLFRLAYKRARAGTVHDSYRLHHDDSLSFSYKMQLCVLFFTHTSATKKGKTVTTWLSSYLATFLAKKNAD